MSIFDFRIFQRITSSGRYVPVVDGIRFIAIIWVVFFHIEIYLTAKTQIDSASPGTVFHLARWLMSVGNIGVPIFFALSGYILAQSYQSFLERSSNGLQRYYLRRLTRLEPPYLVSLAVLAVAAVVTGKLTCDGQLFESLGASVFYLHDLIFGHWSPVNGVAWSLEVEAQFYLLAPLIFLVLKMPKLLWRGLLLGSGILIFSAISFYLPLERRALHRFLQFFLVGTLYYDITRIETITVPLRTFWAWLFFVLLCFGLAASRWNETALGAFASPWLILALFFVLFEAPSLKAAISYAPIARIGGMCYSIYLLHYPLISLAGRVTTRFWWPQYPVFSFGLNVIVITAVVLVASGCFFLLVERPTMDPSWPSKLRGLLRVKRAASVKLKQQ